MLKRFLLAVATVACCSSSIFAQDIFLSFDADALTTSTTLSAPGSSTAFLFSREGFVHRGIDLVISGSDGAVAQFTGGEIFLTGEVPAPPFDVLGPAARFDGQTTEVTDTQIDVIAGAVTTVGVDGGSLFDPAVAGVGVLLGQFEFDAIGGGTSTFSLDFDPDNAPFGVIDASGGIQDTTSLGSGITVTVEGAAIPEPTSTGLLAMGLIGLVARRRR